MREGFDSVGHGSGPNIVLAMYGVSSPQLCLWNKRIIDNLWSQCTNLAIWGLGHGGTGYTRTRGSRLSVVRTWARKAVGVGCGCGQCG